MSRTAVAAADHAENDAEALPPPTRQRMTLKTTREPALRMMHFFCHKNSLFAHNRFSILVFSIKMAESEKIVLVSCIIDSKDIQGLIKHVCLA